MEDENLKSSISDPELSLALRVILNHFGSLAHVRFFFFLDIFDNLKYNFAFFVNKIKST